MVANRRSSWKHEVIFTSLHSSMKMSINVNEIVLVLLQNNKSRMFNISCFVSQSQFNVNIKSESIVVFVLLVVALKHIWHHCFYILSITTGLLVFMCNESLCDLVLYGTWMTMSGPQCLCAELLLCCHLGWHVQRVGKGQWLFPEWKIREPLDHNICISMRQSEWLRLAYVDLFTGAHLNEES